MIRDAIIHLQGKLPVLADIATVPGPTDLAVVCTNLRTRDGKRPSFIEDQHGWFLIPLHDITIVELPADAFESPSDEPSELASGASDDTRRRDPGRRRRSGEEIDTTPLEPDEELLARIRQL